MSKESNLLAAGAVLPYALATKRRSKMTVVNDKTGNRITVRFRRPPGFNRVLVDLMTGPDNMNSYSFIGSLSPNGDLQVSSRSLASRENREKTRTILNWTFAAAQAGNLRTVRCLHEGVCSRCGRVLTTPESIALGLGPTCREAA